MRPRPTRKLALSSMSCSPPPPSHSATTTPALTRKRRASPQPAILPRVALTRRSVARGAAGVNGSAAAVPAVLERPARADRPRLHAVGGRRGRELARRRDRVELRRLAEAVERREHAGADPLGLGAEAGGAQAARPQPRVERPD